jgi:hypothetical protein
MIRAIEHADRRAADTHGWNDFHPFGLIIYRDETSEAVFVAGNPGVRDVAITTGRAARRNFRDVTGLAVMCAAWASRQAVDELRAPETADDRRRARVIYAADISGLSHIYSNVAGTAHHEYGPSHMDAGPAGFLASVLAEATFAAKLTCSSGEHQRSPVL